MNHVTDEDLQRWRRGDVTPDRVIAIARHLEECAECRARSAEPSPLRAIELGLEAIDEHPSFEDLVAYADGSRSESVAAHILTCARCREDVEDRRAAAPPSARRRWLAIAAVLVLALAAALLLTRRPSLDDAPTTTTVVTTTDKPRPPQPDRKREETFETRLARLDPSLRSVAARLISGQLPANIRELRPPGGSERTTRPREGELAVVAPVGTVVDEDRPRFRWSGGSAPYTVEIFDERMQMIATSGPVETREWRPATGLPQSRVLTWQVRREQDGRSEIAPRPPDPPARFRIAAAAAIEQARAATSPLEAALIYAREGMIDAAREKLREVEPSDEIRRMLATLDRVSAPSR